MHLQDQMPLDHALHPTWLAAPSARPQFTRPPGWSRDRCRWPWRRTAAGNAYCGERRTSAVANEFRKGHPARRHHCVSHDAVFAGPGRAREQVSIRRGPGAGGPPPDDKLDRGGDGDGNEGADHPEQGSSEQDSQQQAIPRAKRDPSWFGASPRRRRRSARRPPRSSGPAP